MTEVKSPCIDVCQMDPTTDLCVGCLRTRDEIRAWRGASGDERLEILENIEQRKIGQVSVTG